MKRREPEAGRRGTGRRAPPGHVRVIGGRWRGRRLQVLDRPGLRPTADRARETLFNWLTPHLSGTQCLDLCAGTGALGIEALSRGAAGSCFVEFDEEVARQLEATLRALGVERTEVVQADALRFLSGVPRAFDIVFVDPPFAGPAHGDLCKLLANGWLRPGGWVYLEMDRSVPPPPLPAAWRVHRETAAGQVRYMLLAVDPAQDI